MTVDSFYASILILQLAPVLNAAVKKTCTGWVPTCLWEFKKPIWIKHPQNWPEWKSQIGTVLQTLGVCTFYKGRPWHWQKKKYWRFSFCCYRCKGKDRNKNELAPKWKGPLCLEHKWRSYFMLVFAKIIFPKNFI